MIIHAPVNVKNFFVFFTKSFKKICAKHRNCIFPAQQCAKRLEGAQKTGCTKRCSPYFAVQISATTSTSTNAPFGSAATATQLRAGLPVKYLA